MNNEDLYRQMVEQEREDDLRYQQSLAAKNVKVARREPDAMKAIARYNRDFKPVFEARQRVRNGRGPTGNPIKDAWLKMTGQIKLPVQHVLTLGFGRGHAQHLYAAAHRLLVAVTGFVKHL